MTDAASRHRIPIAAVWLCLLVKLVFYSSFVPPWEGYDEFSHFAFVQYLADNHAVPDLKDAPLSREIVESLQAGPVPWTIRQWEPGWMSHDDYWRGTHPEPPANPAHLRLYEAQQPPLAYLLSAAIYAPFRGASLGARVWIVRVAGSLIVSLVIPLGFFLARRIFGNTARALGVIAVVASMPELMLTADHGGNEPLAIVLGTACVLALCLRRPWLVGCLLGLGLLTKAYFLTLIPAIAVLYAVEYRCKIVKPLAVTLGIAVALSGWWYIRAFLETGSFTGSNIAIAAANSAVPLWQAVLRMQWISVADSALISHIWLGGWSSLVLRSWMYRVIELALIAAAAGLVYSGTRRRITKPLAACIAAQWFFWAGTAWFAISTWRATGESDVPGYYAVALIVPEVICLIAGLATRFAAPVLASCFTAFEVYGAVFLLMPYYAGITFHTARGNVPAARLNRIFSGELLGNLALNKPAFLTPGVMLTLFVMFLIAAAGIVAVAVLAAFRERDESRAGPADGFVPLRSR